MPCPWVVSMLRAVSRRLVGRSDFGTSFTPGVLVSAGAMAAALLSSASNKTYLYTCKGSSWCLASKL